MQSLIKKERDKYFKFSHNGGQSKQSELVTFSLDTKNELSIKWAGTGTEVYPGVCCKAVHLRYLHTLNTPPVKGDTKR